MSLYEYVDYDNLNEETQVQSITSTPAPVKDTTNSKYALISEYWLNEIKSQDDAIRHMINAAVIILGVYFTVIVNNIDKLFTFPSILYDSTYTVNNTTYFTYNNVNTHSLTTTIEILLIIMVPAFCWILCLRKAMIALCPSDKDKKTRILLDNNDSSTEFLIDKTMKKHEIYKESYKLFLMGIIALIVILLLAVFIINQSKTSHSLPPFIPTLRFGPGLASR